VYLANSLDQFRSLQIGSMDALNEPVQDCNRFPGRRRGGLYVPQYLRG
jgi:hypothetical protein